MATGTATLPVLKFRNAPYPPHRYSLSGRSVIPSYHTLARGNRRMGENAKRKNIGLVRVITDDAEFSLGMLLRNDEKHQVRLCTCVCGRRGIFEIIAVTRERIKTIQELN